jgi:hypothetical protein
MNFTNNPEQPTNVSMILFSCKNETGNGNSGVGTNSNNSRDNEDHHLIEQNLVIVIIVYGLMFN